MMTARDIVTLAERIYADFPDYYHYFAEKEFKQQIAAIADVGGIQFGGLRSRNIRVWIE